MNYQKDRIDFLVKELKAGGHGGNDSPEHIGVGGRGEISPRSADPAQQLKVAKRAYR